jgi:hypothetical protein
LIERKQARETPCDEIREQLATLRGGSLRRGPLRRHLKACPGCTEFRAEVRRQRQLVAAVLPVVPTLGLRDTAFAAVGISASSAGGGVLAGGGAGAMLAAKAGVAKVAVVAVATTGAAGGAVAVQQTVSGGDSDRATKQQSDGSAGAVSDRPVDAPRSGGLEADGKAGAGDALDLREGKAQGKQGKAGENGFTPVPGESNGERAREFAEGRGNGQKRGLEREAIAQGGMNPNAGIRGPKPNNNPMTQSPARPDQPASPNKPANAGPDRNANPPEREPGLGPLLPFPPDLAPPGRRDPDDENAEPAL